MYDRVIIVDNNDDVIINGEDKANLQSQMLRDAIKASLLLMEVPTMSFEIFRKSSYEKDLLFRCKKRWRGDMRASVPNWTRKCDYYLEKRIL